MPANTPKRESQRLERPRRRADAERSVLSILDAAVEALANHPEVSMAEIARVAGVARATIYVHFPTRDALIDAVTDRAMTEVSDAIVAAEPDRGDPAEALRRVLAAAWRTLGRYHALVAINVRLPQAVLQGRHHAVMATLLPLIQRGQNDGTFRADVPTTWHLSMLMALVHAASAELDGGRVATQDVEAAMVRTVLGAMTSAP